MRHAQLSNTLYRVLTIIHNIQGRVLTRNTQHTIYRVIVLFL